MEVLNDEARHGKAFAGLLERCFGKKELMLQMKGFFPLPFLEMIGR